MDGGLKFMWKDGSKWIPGGRGFWVRPFDVNFVFCVYFFSETCERPHSYIHHVPLPTPPAPQASLIIYNVPNGIGSVEQKDGSGWKQTKHLSRLGQQWLMQQPSDYRTAKTFEFVVRVKDVDGKVYGTYKVPLPCSGPCKDNTHVKHTNM